MYQALTTRERHDRHIKSNHKSYRKYISARRASQAKYDRTHKEIRKAWVAKNIDKVRECSRKASARWVKRNPDGPYAVKLKMWYGMSFSDYQKMLQKQGSRCAICRRPELRKNHHLHVDHCHKTKVVRGLLCADCNLGLGRFKDNQSLLKSAIKYLGGK